MAVGSVWLIGAGGMAEEYLRVLAALGVENVTVVGRDAVRAASFTARTGHETIEGGLDRFLGGCPPSPDAAIVAVGVDSLYSAASALLRYGVDRLLLEKPGGLTLDEIDRLAGEAAGFGVEVPLAYNRRFYASVRAARRCIEEDGGLRSMTFDFTEWGHEIALLNKPPEVLANWFLLNSTHVTDLAFFLGGDPAFLHSQVGGALPWHPAGAIFSGCGVTRRDVPFSYHADWGAPGRWGVELMTAGRRLFLRPLEKLQVQRIGTVAIEPVALDDARIDVDFKPGLYRQTEAFLSGRLDDFRRLSEQASLSKTYGRVAGYRTTSIPEQKKR